MICAVCAPYRAAFALETAQVQAKKAIWQLDPMLPPDYQAPAATRGAGAAEPSGRRLYHPAGRLGITPPGAPLAAAAEKVHVLDFPSLVPPAAVPNHATDSKKRCVFCGSLYPGLREPGFALELFRALGPASGWTLTMAGGAGNTLPRTLPRPRLYWANSLNSPAPCPPKPPAPCSTGRCSLNLGNAVDNQLPSKLFDYFAAGKPVLHLCVIENDPAALSGPLSAGAGAAPRPG